jgi:hypothetical protein
MNENVETIAMGVDKDHVVRAIPDIFLLDEQTQVLSDCDDLNPGQVRKPPLGAYPPLSDLCSRRVNNREETKNFRSFAEVRQGNLEQNNERR